MIRNSKYLKINKPLKSILIATMKGVVWLILAFITLLIPLAEGFAQWDFAAYPLGGKLFLEILFSRQPVYGILLSSDRLSLDSLNRNIIPAEYQERYDSLGNVRWNVIHVDRYPSHIAVIVDNLIDGERKYCIIKKPYDLENPTTERIKKDCIFETHDSISFIRKCGELKLPSPSLGSEDHNN